MCRVKLENYGRRRSRQIWGPLWTSTSGFADYTSTFDPWVSTTRHPSFHSHRPQASCHLARGFHGFTHDPAASSHHPRALAPTSITVLFLVGPSGTRCMETCSLSQADARVLRAVEVSASESTCVIPSNSAFSVSHSTTAAVPIWETLLSVYARHPCVGHVTAPRFKPRDTGLLSFQGTMADKEQGTQSLVPRRE